MLTKKYNSNQGKIKKYIYSGLILSCLIFLIIPACGGGGSNNSSIGNNEHPMQAVGLKLKWSFPTEDCIYSSPALAQDGTIYIGSDDYSLYALYPSGDLRWRFQTGGAVFSSPAVGNDGTIYVGSNDNYLYAVNPDGSQKWSYLTGDNIFSTPAIDNTGTVYTGSNDGYLYALSSEGELQWITFLGGWVSSPVIGPDNTIYVGAGDINWVSLALSTGEFYALHSDNGEIEWQVELNVFSRPAIGSNGTLYAASTNGAVYALNPDNGSELWEYKTDGPILSCPKILKGETDTIIIGSDDQNLYALTSSGVLIWIARLNAKIRSSAETGTDGTIYIGCHDKCLHALDLENGIQTGYFPTSRPITTIPAISQDGTIYFGSQDSNIYALRNT